MNAGSTAEAHPITSGPASGDLTVVDKGVAEGDRVVTDGQYKLQVNARVSIISSAAAAEMPKATGAAGAAEAAK